MSWRGNKQCRNVIITKGKQVIAMVLASLMVVSTPLASYAGDAGGIGGGGDGSSSVGGSGGNNSFTMEQQGYRFTIVDGQGKAVCQTVDVWKQAPPSSGLEYLTTYKTQSFGETNEIKGMTLDNFVKAIQLRRDDRNVELKAAGKPELPAVEEPATAMSGKVGSPTLNGEDFRKWMLQGVNMDLTPSYGGGSGDSGAQTNPKKTVTKVVKNADGSKTTYYSDGSSYTSKPPSKGNSGSSSGGGNMADKADEAANKAAKLACERYVATCEAHTNKCKLESISNPMTKQKNETLAQRGLVALSSYGEAKNVVTSYKASGTLTSAQASAYMQRLSKCNDKRKAFQKALNNVTIKKASIERDITKEKLSLAGVINKVIFNEITVYAAETETKADDEYSSTEEGVIKDLLSIKTGSDYLFKMDGIGDKQSPLEFMAEKGYTLIAEPLMWERPWSYSNGSYSQYVAGTPTNLAEWAVSVSGSYNWLTAGAHMTLICKNFPRSMAMDKDYNLDTMDDNLNGTHILTVFNALPGHTVDGDSKIPLNELTGNMELNARTINIARNIGYGCHVYFPSGGGTSSQHTYDTDIVEKGPAPDPSTFTPETEYGSKSKNIKIEKYYEDLSTTGEFEPVAFFGRDLNPHKISIDDEEPAEYKVADWFTSTKDKVPPVGGNVKTETFTKYKDAYNDGQYKYEEAKDNRITTITILPEDNEVVLHVLLRQVQPLKVDIIKVYDATDGTTDYVTVEEDVEIDNNTYYPKTPEDGYNYTEGTTNTTPITTEPNNWAEVPKDNHTTDKGINVKEDTKSIYVHYVKDPTAIEGIVLHENEISHNYSLVDLAPGGMLANAYRIFDNLGSKGDCNEVTGYYSCGDEDCDSDHPEYCDESVSAYYSNSSYSYNVINNMTYEKDFIYQTREEATSISGTADNTSGFDGTSILPQLHMTIQRNFNDKVTLYPGNKSEDISKLKDMGFSSEGYKPANTRYTALKESERLEWFNTFTTNWIWKDINNPDGYWDCSSGHRYFGDWVQNSGDRNDSLGRANSTYNVGNNTEIRAFLGKTNEGLNVPERKADTLLMFDKSFTKNKANYVTEMNNFEFYPYIKMNFETLDSGISDIKVTSENLSKIKNVNNIDIGVYKSSNKNPLELNSTQWSTHAKAQKYLNEAGISDKNSILPGGAIYELKGSNTSSEAPETWIGVRSFEMSIPDDLKVALDKQEGIKTTSEAKANGQKLKEEAKEVVDKYQIVQWIASGIYKNKTDFDKASDLTLISGVGSKDKFGDNKLSTDLKYYLREIESGSGRSDIDILEERFNQTVYRVYSDTYGKVTVTKNGAELISSQLKANKDISALLGNAEVKLLEDKTRAISNYVNAIDIGIGADRDNKSWYNEAFDGIEIVMSEIAFNIGFGNGNDVRSSALDTKLTGKLTDRRDIYNFEAKSLKEKARTSQFATSKKSTESEASSKAPGYVGSMNGIDIIIPNIEELLYSKVFFIPNANVTDLN